MFKLFFLLCSVYGRENRVTLSDGTTLQGKMLGEVTEFLGIRYAQPPGKRYLCRCRLFSPPVTVGKLRWKPPSPYTNPNTQDIVDSTHYGEICSQAEGSFILGSEDCLYLNVFVHLNNTSSKVPIALYIHGGSYITGSSNFYPGSELVKYWDNNVIVVTINYRLNVKSFLIVYFFTYNFFLEFLLNRCLVS
jgi:para-nitrobenzyl esterase